jgi:hypothetical protein
LDLSQQKYYTENVKQETIIKVQSDEAESKIQKKSFEKIKQEAETVRKPAEPEEPSFFEKFFAENAIAKIG